MSEPLVEVVYSLSEEDLLQHVRVKLKSRFKDPLVRTKVSIVLGFCFLAAGVVMMAWVLLGPRPVNHNYLLSAAWLCVFGAVSGYMRLKGYRGFYEKLRRKAKTTDCFVFRAYANNFTITRPGISETSTNWTAIKSVNLNKDYLNIFTKEDTMYRVPVRFIRQEQWDTLKALLHTVWD